MGARSHGQGGQLSPLENWKVKFWQAKNYIFAKKNLDKIKYIPSSTPGKKRIITIYNNATASFSLFNILHKNSYCQDTDRKSVI